MIAVIDTSTANDWAETMGDLSWALLPVANRPLLDYWLEACTEFGVRSVHVILGEGAKEVEDYIASGDRWNVVVEYVFSRNNETAVDYLKSISEYWENGVLFFAGPFFMRKRQGFRPEGYANLKTCCHDQGKIPYFIYGKNGEELRNLLANCGSENRGLEEIHIHPYLIGSIGGLLRIEYEDGRGRVFTLCHRRFLGNGRKLHWFQRADAPLKLSEGSNPHWR